MKKTFQLMIVLLLVLGMLTACSNGKDVPVEDPTSEPTAEASEEPTAEPTEEPSEEPTEEPSEEPTEEPSAEPTEALTAANVAVRVKMVHQDTDEGECAILYGINVDGATAWTLTYRTNTRTELKLIEEIGSWQDRYYFNNNGCLTAVRIADGKILWTDAGFGGASISSLIGGDGSIFVCGWYGPDFYAVNCEGQTLIKYLRVSEDYCWPGEMQWCSDREIEVLYHGSADGETTASFVVNVYTPQVHMK